MFELFKRRPSLPDGRMVVHTRLADDQLVGGRYIEEFVIVAREREFDVVRVAGCEGETTFTEERTVCDSLEQAMDYLRDTVLNIKTAGFRTLIFWEAPAASDVVDGFAAAARAMGVGVIEEEFFFP